MDRYPRLQSLTVSDFRSIAGEWRIPLDAGAVLIHGYNGAGKTSLLSALELACTGRIAHLDDAGDEEYKRHLHHRGTASAQVAVSIQAAQNETQTTTLRIDEQGAHGKWLLTPSLSEFFTERCFLPQATLARLLEIYVPREARPSDTGLIRFVKELLGLDSLDSLIEGLDATGHISRAERVSTDWQVAKSLLAERELLLQRDQARLGALQASYEENIAALTGRFAPGSDISDDELVRIAATFLDTESALDARMAATRESALRLDGAESLLSGLDDNTGVLAQSAEVADELRDQYADWHAKRGRPLVEWSMTERPDMDDVSRLDAEVLARVLSSSISASEEELNSRRVAAAKAQDLVARSQEIEGRTLALQAELARIDQTRSDFTSSSATSELSGLLASVLEHVTDDFCPVCDQPFGGEGLLREHIRAKVLDLNRASEALLKLESARAEVVRDLETSRQGRAIAEAERASMDSVEELESDIRRLVDRLGRLRELSLLAESGQALRARLNEAEDVEATRMRARAIAKRAVQEIAAAARLADVSLTRGTPLQRLAAVRAVVQRQLGETARDAADREEVASHLAAVQRSAEGLSVAQSDVQEATRAVELLQQQLQEARRRKEAASSLRKRAEELRAQISNRVFDDRLNGAWATLFRSLVPSEPFIPQFVPRVARPRNFDVGLETVHRDGTRAASPGAMLSQGNANTAALSLFLALHFAVAPRLPWLVFDDPVQSMDDLHISNFAALVKQLIRNNGRQVVIAVHQRELFDYLMLELSPGSPGEELLGIRLDRSYGKSSITHSRVTFTPDESVGPSSAA